MPKSPEAPNMQMPSVPFDQYRHVGLGGSTGYQYIQCNTDALYWEAHLSICGGRRNTVSMLLDAKQKLATALIRVEYAQKRLNINPTDPILHNTLTQMQTEYDNAKNEFEFYQMTYEMARERFEYIIENLPPGTWAYAHAHTFYSGSTKRPITQARTSDDLEYHAPRYYNGCHDMVEKK